MSRRPRAFLALLCLSLVLAVAACGKRGTPQPPPGQENTYPRTYPHD